MDTIIEKIEILHDDFENFKKTSLDYQSLIFLHIMRETYSSNKSNSFGNVVAFTSLYLGMISLFLVAVLEDILPPRYRAISLIILCLYTALIVIFNIRDFRINSRKTIEINKLIGKVCLDLQNRT